MPEFLHLRPGDARRVPWRNGRGVTEELALWPPEASFERGDFDARISLSSVREPGPFSPFPGFDRVLLVTRGGGLRLSHGTDAPPADLPPLRAYPFQGEWTTSAELPHGPVDDFNVIVRRDRCCVDVSVAHLCLQSLRGPLRASPLSGPPVWIRSADALAHVLSGTVLAHARGLASPVLLQPGETLLMRGVDPDAHVQLFAASTADVDAGVVLLVRLARA